MKQSRRSLHLEGLKLLKRRRKSDDWTESLSKACEALADKYLGVGRGRKSDSLRSKQPDREVPSSHFMAHIGPTAPYGS